jgi:hypothetical protein
MLPMTCRIQVDARALEDFLAGRVHADVDRVEPASIIPRAMSR